MHTLQNFRTYTNMHVRLSILYIYIYIYMCVSSCVGQNLYHKLPPMNITSQLCHPSSVEWFCLTSSKSHVAWQSLGTSRSSPPWCSPLKAGGILTVNSEKPWRQWMMSFGRTKALRHSKLLPLEEVSWTWWYCWCFRNPKQPPFGWC